MLCPSREGRVVWQCPPEPRTHCCCRRRASVSSACHAAVTGAGPCGGLSCGTSPGRRRGGVHEEVRVAPAAQRLHAGVEAPRLVGTMSPVHAHLSVGVYAFMVI